MHGNQDRMGRIDDHATSSSRLPLGDYSTDALPSLLLFFEANTKLGDLYRCQSLEGYALLELRRTPLAGGQGLRRKMV